MVAFQAWMLEAVIVSLAHWIWPWGTQRPPRKKAALHQSEELQAQRRQRPAFPKAGVLLGQTQCLPQFSSPMGKVRVGWASSKEASRRAARDGRALPS